MTRFAITGVGSISPLAHDPDGLAEALEAGRRAIGEASLDGLPSEGARCVGRVLDFDAAPYVPPRRARRLDPTSVRAVSAARQVLGAAGLEEGDDRLGVILGTSTAGASPMVRFLTELFRVSPEAAPPFEFPNTVANAPASHISIELGLIGPNATLNHSESVMGQALLWGRSWLEAGRCDRLLVGAADEWTPYQQVGFEQVGALRRGAEARLDDPGIVLSEGATLLCLENEGDARERGASALAHVAGVGLAQVSGEPFRWHPDAAALRRAIEAALEDAGLSAADLGSVFLAANGVPEMEAAELRALEELLGDRGLAATGVKGAVGERAASGALSVAAAALARQRRRLPPFAGGALEHRIGAVRLLDRATELPDGATLVLLYGAGGNLAAILLT